ncbi:MAG: hypothetical protein D6805_06935 [Planctomycetota bacterium]|nr:MAG: hypothetical protein D6805_06935 [Planctomycetota bacterium]
MRCFQVYLSAFLLLFLPCGCQKKVDHSPKGNSPTSVVSSQKSGTSYRQALERGVAWLMAQQKENGGWPVFKDGPTNVGYTALAVMAVASSPSEIRQKYASSLAKGAEFLLKYQQKDGRFDQQGHERTNYYTSLSLLALVRLDKEKYKAAIEKAKNFLINTQFYEGFHNVSPDSPHYGGWDYRPKKGGLNADLSNTQFTLQALKEAGVPKDSPVWKRAMKFLSRCQNRTESNDAKGFVVLNDGGFMYFPGKSQAGVKKTPKGDAHPSYASMTYAGLKSFIYCNATKDDPRVQAAYNWLRKHYTLEENYGMGTRQKPQDGKRGLFYYYQTMAKALRVWGERYIITPDGTKHDWAKELADKLVSLQKPEGYWVNANTHWQEGSPYLVTSYSLLALNDCLKAMAAYEK